MNGASHWRGCASDRRDMSSVTSSLPSSRPAVPAAAPRSYEPSCHIAVLAPVETWLNRQEPRRSRAASGSVAVVGALSDVRVDIVAPPEETRFRESMRAHHQLGALHGIGETPRLVAHHRGQWLMLVVFSEPAPTHDPRPPERPCGSPSSLRRPPSAYEGPPLTPARRENRPARPHHSLSYRPITVKSRAGRAKEPH